MKKGSGKKRGGGGSGAAAAHAAGGNQGPQNANRGIAANARSNTSHPPNVAGGNKGPQNANVKHQNSQRNNSGNHGNMQQPDMQFNQDVNLTQSHNMESMLNASAREDHGYPHHEYIYPDEPTDDEMKEREHFERVLGAFASYSFQVKVRIANAERKFKFLSQKHKDLVPGFHAKLRRLEAAADANQRFLNELIQPHMIFQNDQNIAVHPSEEPQPQQPQSSNSNNKSKPNRKNPDHMEISSSSSSSATSSSTNSSTNSLASSPTNSNAGLPSVNHDNLSNQNNNVNNPNVNLHFHQPLPRSKKEQQQLIMDIDKVRSTLSQCMRDWSSQGEYERNVSYLPIVNELQLWFPPESLKSRKPVKVLIPGAGLGRLAFEVALKGYHCQGNEFSYFMLITSNYFLNRIEQKEQFEIYPWVHQFSNVWSVDQQLTGLKIPDIVPQGLPEGSDFSMTVKYKPTKQTVKQTMNI